ncbi:MAG: SRPBCC family protein [Gammaproteobacteria bacterium]|nr:SRPBCC family protein [Gammaproteobacteria bacterium]
MAEFCFVTLWRIEAPLAQVCEAISQCARWPEWWPGVEKVEEIEPGAADGIGSLRRFTWKGRLLYRLTFDIRITRVVPLQLLEGRASGEVEGIGCWYFSCEGAVTIVRYEWQVRTTRGWMNVLAPLARPLFKWNHDQVMRQGAAGLTRLLQR